MNKLHCHVYLYVTVQLAMRTVHSCGDVGLLSYVPVLYGTNFHYSHVVIVMW